MHHYFLKLFNSLSDSQKKEVGFLKVGDSVYINREVLNEAGNVNWQGIGPTPTHIESETEDYFVVSTMYKDRVSSYLRVRCKVEKHLCSPTALTVYWRIWKLARLNKKSKLKNIENIENISG